MKNRTKKIAFCGVLCSLGVVFLYLGTVVQVIDLSSAVAASVVIAIVAANYGYGYGIMCYGVCSVISLALFPAFVSTISFVALAGYYPVLKTFVEKRLKNQILVISLKCAFFLIALYLAFWLGGELFYFVPEKISGTFIADIFPVVYFTVGLIALFLYDLALGKIMKQFGHILQRIKWS